MRRERKKYEIKRDKQTAARGKEAGRKGGMVILQDRKRNQEKRERQRGEIGRKREKCFQ